MKRPSVVHVVVALVLATVALVAFAQGRLPSRPTFWPGLLQNPPTPPLKEWYSDVPWHQKTGTYVSNEIDVPIVFPYEALPQKEIDYCKAPGGDAARKLSEEDCMIEVGVANILAYYRTDSLYDPADPKFKNTECAVPFTCTEVRLEVSRQRASSSGGTVALEREQFGTQFTITDASTYGPQMPWELAHYCQSKWMFDIQDPVCYADYFSPMNDGFNVILPGVIFSDWPRSAPWSPWPAAADNIHCAPGQPSCSFALAGFRMSKVAAPPAGPALAVPSALTFAKYNDFLLQWFNNALVAFPTELGAPEIQQHFPWNGKPVTWADFIYPRAVMNPFLGNYDVVSLKQLGPVGRPSCDTGLTSAFYLAGNPPALTPDTTAPQVCTDAQHVQASGFRYPGHCTLDDLAAAAGGDSQSVDKLRGCGLNFEIHPNGWLSQWPSTGTPNFQSIVAGEPFNYTSNQYGRTAFVMGGVPGMQMGVSFYTSPGSPYSIYEQVHNASVFSLFMPAANIADAGRAMKGRNYQDKTFYHTLLMSNHMESDPEPFADGIRGKVLWHNEYRMQPMYDARTKYTWLRDRRFQASFDPLQSKYDKSKAPAPFHNNTCDGCHVRNGSGVPINAKYKLDPAQTKEYMADGVYSPYVSGKDYTFTGVIRPMKLVFFDLQPGTGPKTSRYSQPLDVSPVALTAVSRALATDSVYYSSAIMNYYGDSFHVSPQEQGAPDFTYDWDYAPADDSRVVDKTPRNMHDIGGTKLLVPQQIRLKGFTTPTTENKCQFTPPVGNNPWPAKCADINSGAILQAVTADAATHRMPTVGYMHLNGRRLGNLGAIEAIPDREVVQWQTAQQGVLDKAAGEIVWSPGTRDGALWKKCAVAGSSDCVAARFGWLGDRGTLDDQVANAAFVEMNMISSQGYDKYAGQTGKTLLRYKAPNCGPANKTCVESTGNSDLSERDVDRMADYGRWLGIPTRSEIQVSQQEVIDGEALFNRMQCATCHVIKRIDITKADAENSPLSKSFRDRLGRHVSARHTPFLSYLGTDLLMHDMGYLSQVGDANVPIRDANGFVLPGYEAYVQKIRTPALKGLRFNSYVTDAHRNTKNPGKDGQTTGDPGCDFLLHDGRACNAIEAAFLHDGPAVLKLRMIEKLRDLSDKEIMTLRAFLYSL